MKRFTVLLYVGALLLSLTACGQRPTTETTSSALSVQAAQPPTPEPAVTELPTVKEVCDDYLSGHASVHIASDSDGWIRLDEVMGGETYYPGAIYVQPDWTPEAVLQSYRDQTAPWVTNQRGGAWQYLWSADYLTEFTVRDGWFYIDQVQITPVNPETHSVALNDVLEAYQSGEWDRQSEWRSEDLSTTVSMSPTSGELIYIYNYATYPDEVAYSEYAHAGYASRPCYEQFKQVDVEIISTSTSGGPGASIVPPLPDEDRYDWLADFSDILNFTERAKVSYYLDYPSGILSKDVIDVSYDSLNGNLYTMTADGVQLYHQGTTLNLWQCDVDSEDSFLALYCDGTDYLVTGAEIIRLNPDNSTTVVCDHVVDVGYDFEGLFYAFCLNDQELSFWHPSCTELHVIATGVTDACYDGIVCYTDTAGTTYILARPDDDATWLEVGARDLMYHQEYELLRLKQGAPSYYCREFLQSYSIYYYENAMLKFLEKYGDPTERSRVLGD